jgi:PIN like domain
MPDRYRWYADESVLGFGKLLAKIRDDVVYPGHPAIPEITPGALDTEWMPIAAARGWIVFHRDRRIRTRPTEVAVFTTAGLRAVWFGGRRDLAPRDQLALAERHWDRIEQEVTRLGPGPWALDLVDSGPREVPLVRRRG